MLAWWALALGIVGCGLEQGECRTRDDCADGQACLAPGWDPGCGIWSSGCASCGTDEYCAPAWEGCTDGYCRPRCADDAGCGEDERCVVETGTCRDLGCDEGFVCDPMETCDPTSTARHGCVRVLCGADRDCPADGFCVGAHCYTTPGTCGSDLPPP